MSFLKQNSILKSIVKENFEEEINAEAPNVEVEVEVELPGAEAEITEIDTVNDELSAGIDYADDSFEQVEHGLADAEDVEGVADAALTDLEDETYEGLDNTALEGMRTNLRMFSRRWNIPVKSISSKLATENFEDKSFSGRREQSKVAAEGVKELAIKAIEIFKKAFNATINWLKEFWKNNFTKVGRAQEGLKKVKDKVDSSDDSNAGEKIDTPKDLIKAIGYIDNYKIEANVLTKAADQIINDANDMWNFVDEYFQILEKSYTFSVEKEIKEDSGESLIDAVISKLNSLEKKFDATAAFKTGTTYIGGNKIVWSEGGLFGLKRAGFKLVKDETASGVPEQMTVPSKRDAQDVIDSGFKVVDFTQKQRKGVEILQDRIEKYAAKGEEAIKGLEDGDEAQLKEYQKAIKITNASLRLLSAYSNLTVKLALDYSSMAARFADVAVKGGKGSGEGKEEKADA